MSLFDRIFGGGAAKSVARPAVSIEGAIEDVSSAALELEGSTPEPELAIARFQDALRGRGVRPMPVAELTPLLTVFDEAARERWMILAALIEGAALREAISAFGVDAGAAITQAGAIRTIDAKQLLTVELIRQSPVRGEELARAFIANLGLSIRGESEAISKERAARIDYATLLAEADRAKKSAESRTEELRKLQEAAGQRRGKW